VTTSILTPPLSGSESSRYSEEDKAFFLYVPLLNVDDTEQFTLMRLKGIVPTSDNPFGVLGPLLGQHNNQNETKQPSQNPFKGINKFFGKIPGGNKK
jgi:hypothetical protein